MGQIDPKLTQHCFGHAMAQVATKMGKMRLGCPKYQPALPAGCEGKCGMAAIRLKPGMSFEGENFYAFTKETLPSYAAPRFVRIQVSGPRLWGGLPGGGFWLFVFQRWSWGFWWHPELVTPSGPPRAGVDFGRWPQGPRLLMTSFGSPRFQ